MILAVTETALAARSGSGRIALETGARQVVEQDVELRLEQLAPLPAQIVEQLVAMLDEQIQTAVRLVLPRQGEIFAQQIAQGGALIPLAVDRNSLPGSISR